LAPIHVRKMPKGEAEDLARRYLERGRIAWLALPLPVLLASYALFFSATAVLLVWLSFSRATGTAVQSLKGVVAPFMSALAAILAHRLSRE
jgi:hypothetical protein